MVAFILGEGVLGEFCLGDGRVWEQVSIFASAQTWLQILMTISLIISLLDVLIVNFSQNTTMLSEQMKVIKHWYCENEVYLEVAGFAIA